MNMFKKSDSFTKLVRTSLLAATVGLAAGLVLGLVIWFVTSLFAGNQTDLPPIQLATFLGMGMGTVLGAILGGIAALKE